jgi:hypothetical protein
MSTGHPHVYEPKLTIGVGQIIVGGLLVIVALLNLANLDKANQVMKRADAIIADHEEDMAKLSDTARSRNEMFRLLGEKAGVNAAEMDEAFGLDSLAAHKPKPKRKRMGTP